MINCKYCIYCRATCEKTKLERINYELMKETYNKDCTCIASYHPYTTIKKCDFFRMLPIEQVFQLLLDDIYKLNERVDEIIDNIGDEDI